jgi:CheY-like chemotaxis protein/tetratricopeptide (TPR) repeat protein
MNAAEWATPPRVLVIEDDADTAELLRRTLREAGFAIELVASGHAGRRRLAEGDVDVVLLDYRLQDEDGITCLQAIHRRDPGLPVVVMTGHGSEEIAVEAMKSGATDYVVKHRRWLETVCRTVRAALGSGRRTWERAPVTATVLPPASAEAELPSQLAAWRAAGAPDAVVRTIDDAVAAATRASAEGRRDAAAQAYEAARRALAGAVPAAPVALATTLCTAHAESLWRAGRQMEARAIGEDAIASARGAGDPELLARAAMGYAGRLQGFGAAICDQRVCSVLEEALSALPAGDGPLRALVMARLAEELAVSPAAAPITLGREAVRMARRLEDPVLVAAVLHTTHWALWEPQEVDDRRELAEEVIALAEGVGDPTMQLEGSLLRVWSLLDGGDFCEAEEELDRAGLLNAGVRQPYYAWLIAIARACLAFAGGRLHDVEALAAEALSLGHQAQNPNAVLVFGAQIASLYWYCGRNDGVEASISTIADTFPALRPVVECALVTTLAEAGRVEEARDALRAAMTDGPWRRLRNIMWLPAVNYLGEACAILRAAEWAEELYGLLRPYAGRLVTLPPAVIYGAVSHTLGALAAIQGDCDRAARHFDEAMDMESRAQMRHQLARTQMEYARMLLERGRADELLLARSLLAAAERTAEELGMPTLLRRAQALHGMATGAGSGAGAPSGTRPVEHVAEAAVGPRPATGIFRCDGDFWTLEFGGQRGLIRDAKGLHYLRQLLEHPGTETAASELVAGTSLAGGQASPAQRGIPAGADARALAAYRARLRELMTEIAEAERLGAAAELDGFRLEREALETEIEASLGMGGRTRRAGDTLDRSRIAVKKAIDYVLARLREPLPALAHHLATQIKTGTFCVYRVDPARPILWSTRA